MSTKPGQLHFVDEEHLSEIFLGNRSLRLLTLITCHGGVQSLEHPLSGLGRRLVERGLPAVISMQDTVSFETAEDFPEHFYKSLARSGCVDAAVNETRHQLFLLDRQSSRWSDPVLFMRLEEGAIWRPAEEAARSDQRRLPTEKASTGGVHVTNFGSQIGNQFAGETINVNLPSPSNTRRKGS